MPRDLRQFAASMSQPPPAPKNPPRPPSEIDFNDPEQRKALLRRKREGVKPELPSEPPEERHKGYKAGCLCERCDRARERARKQHRKKRGRKDGKEPAPPRINWADPDEVRAYKALGQREYMARKLAEQLAAGVKHCNGCDTTKPFDQFCPDPRRPLGVEPRCRECRNTQSKVAYRRKHGERKRHGAAYDKERMLVTQNGLCYLHQEPLPSERHLVHLDHDHRCCPPGKSCPTCRRGLACGACNTAIGLLGDDPARIRLVADNLERAQAEYDLRLTEAEAC